MSRIAKALSSLIGREGTDPLIEGLTPAQKKVLAEEQREHDRLVGPPQGLFSGKDAVAAIRFALGIDDHYDMRAFLEGWLEGDTREWPEFKPDILVLPPGAIA